MEDLTDSRAQVHLEPDAAAQGKEVEGTNFY